MTTITAEAQHIASRIIKTIPILQTIERHLDDDEADAITGPSPSGSGRRHVPTDDPEAPTGHTDPTGDAAVSGAVAAVRRRRLRVTDALHDLSRMIDHLELVCRAVTADGPPPETTPAELCTGGILMPDGSERPCGRLREQGDEMCATCKAIRDADTRRMSPRCWVPECHDPVESYDTRKGPAFRGMELVGKSWQPKPGVEPMCARHRKMAERVA